MKPNCQCSPVALGLFELFHFLSMSAQGYGRPIFKKLPNIPWKNDCLTHSPPGIESMVYIGRSQIRGALFNFSVVKKFPFFRLPDAALSSTISPVLHELCKFTLMKNIP